MIISRNRFIPSEHSSTWTLTGCTALTSTDNLTNNRVASASRFTITDANSFSISTSIPEPIYTNYFESGMVVGVMGLSLPSNAYAFLRITSSGLTTGTYISSVKTLPDGSKALWFYLKSPFNGASAFFPVTLKIEFGDNVNNVTADSTFDVGEFWIGDGKSYPIKPSFKVKPQNDSAVRRSTNGTPWPLLRKDYRSLSAELIPKDYTTAYGTQAASWATMRGALNKAASCVAIPTYLDTASAVDQSIVTQQALFGWCSNRGEIQRHPDGVLYNLSLEFTEYPPSTL